jgi:hypothetical protein
MYRRKELQENYSTVKRQILRISFFGLSIKNQVVNKQLLKIFNFKL